MKNEVLYIDMDHVMCDYAEAYAFHRMSWPNVEYPQSIAGFWSSIRPIKGAIRAVKELCKHYDVYILTAPSVYNPNSYSEKRMWVEEHLGFDMCHKLILSPNKGLLKGKWLIDDNIEGKGQEDFEGILCQFGSDKYPDWGAVLKAFVPIRYRIPPIKDVPGGVGLSVGGTVTEREGNVIKKMDITSISFLPVDLLK